MCCFELIQEAETPHKTIVVQFEILITAATYSQIIVSFGLV